MMTSERTVFLRKDNPKLNVNFVLSIIPLFHLSNYNWLLLRMKLRTSLCLTKITPLSKEFTLGNYQKFSNYPNLSPSVKLLCCRKII